MTEPRQHLNNLPPSSAMIDSIPLWVRLASPIAFLTLAIIGSTASMMCIAWLGAPRVPIRNDEHWTARAPRIWPFLKQLAATRVVLSIATVFPPVFYLSTASFLDRILVAGLCVIGTTIATGFVAQYWVLKVRPELDSLQGIFKFRCFMYGYAIVFLTGFIVMPSRLNWWSPAVVIGTAVLTLGAWWFTVDVARFAGFIKPASTDLGMLVDDIAKKMNVDTPPVFTFDVFFVNAYALLGRKQIGFTSNIMDVLNPEEIQAIAAHEIGHLNEPGSVVVKRIIVLTFAALLTLSMPVYHAHGFLGMYALIFGIIVVVLLFRRKSVKLEILADEAAISVSDPAVYARALEKIYEFNVVPAVLRKNVTHPALYDRMLTAGVEPDYDRPAPPKKTRMLVPIIVTFVLHLVIGVTLLIGPKAFEPPLRDEVKFALTGDMYDLSNLTALLLAEQKLEKGLVYTAYSYQKFPNEYSAAMYISALVQSDRCNDAKTVLNDFDTISQDSPLWGNQVFYLRRCEQDR